MSATEIFFIVLTVMSAIALYGMGRLTNWNKGALFVGLCCVLFWALVWKYIVN